MALPSTTDEVWAWNGISLNQPYWDTATIGGTRLALPTLRGQDIELAYRSGKAWRAKYPDSRTITLVMWVAGIDQTTGNPASDQRLAWNNNWQQMRQAFWTRNLAGSVQGQLSRLWYLTQGGVSQLVAATALGEVAGSMEPAMTGRTRADFSVDILLADPYFYGSPQTAALTLGVDQPVTNLGEGVVGEGQPSSVCSFTATFNGPLTFPTITNSTWGVSVSYLGTVASGVSLTMDFLRFTCTDSTGANQIAYVAHAGSRVWLGLGPGVNHLTLSSLSSSDSGNAVLAYNSPYL